MNVEHILKTISFRRTLKAMIYSCRPSQEEKFGKSHNRHEAAKSIIIHDSQYSKSKEKEKSKQKKFSESKKMLENFRLNQQRHECGKLPKSLRFSRSSICEIFDHTLRQQTYICERDLPKKNWKRVDVMERLLEACSIGKNLINQRTVLEYISLMRLMRYDPVRGTKCQAYVKNSKNCVNT